jgi:myo-inositol-1(or 4)-monophosphatase
LIPEPQWRIAFDTADTLRTNVGKPLIDDWLQTCEAAARAGGYQLQALRGQFQTRVKGPADLVTDADEASQEAVRRVIANRFPDHVFIGEERPVGELLGATEQLTWIVDPLDGTTNYVHGYPQYAVSVALVRGRELLAGVIYDPVNEQCFVAGSGRGATCNGVLMNTSKVVAIDEALVAVSLPARVVRDSPDLLDFDQAAQVCQAVRRSGSAALNFAYVAKGALDAFWATQTHPWDVAAGVLLVREAGGMVTSRSGGEFNLWDPHFVAAANRDLHAKVLDMLRPYKAN